MTFVALGYKHTTAPEESQPISISKKVSLPGLSRSSLFNEQKSQHSKNKYFYISYIAKLGNNLSPKISLNKLSSATNCKHLVFRLIFNKQKQHFCRLCSVTFPLSRKRESMLKRPLNCTPKMDSDPSAKHFFAIGRDREERHRSLNAYALIAKYLPSLSHQ